MAVCAIFGLDFIGIYWLLLVSLKIVVAVMKSKVARVVGPY